MSRYNSLPIAQKRAEALARVRAPAVTCPSCDTQVMPADLLAHLKDRCAGLREPSTGDVWVCWKEALAMGVAKMTLSYWARRGDVRTRGTRGDRQYLLRDLALRVAHQRLSRRR